jgi:hypothetical protein
LKGDGGAYILACHVRPKFKKDETFRIWDGIIRGAALFPNPKNDEIILKRSPISRSLLSQSF